MLFPLRCLFVSGLASVLINLCCGLPLKNGLDDTTNDESVDMDVSTRGHGNNTCRCKAGYHSVPGCKSHNKTRCLPCEDGTFSDRTNERTRCHTCSVCKDTYFEVTPCTKTYDAKCAPCHKASTNQQNLKDYLAKCRMSSDDPIAWLSMFGLKSPKLDLKFDDNPTDDANTQGGESFIIGGMMGDTFIQNNGYKTNAISTSRTTPVSKVTPSTKPMPISTANILTTEKMAKDSSTTEVPGEKSHSIQGNRGPVEPQNAQPAFVQDDNGIVITDNEENSVKTKAQVKHTITEEKHKRMHSDTVAVVDNGTLTDQDDGSLILGDVDDHQSNNTEETHMGAVNKDHGDERLVSYWAVIGAALIAAVVFFLLGFIASRRASKPKEDDKPALPPDPLLLQRRSSVEFRYRRRFSLDQPGTGASLLSRSDSFRGKPLMVDKSVQTTSSQEPGKSKKGIMFWRSSSSSSASSPTVKDVDDVFASGPKDKMKVVNDVESSIPLLSSALSSNISPVTQAENARDADGNQENNRELKPNNSFRTFKSAE